jgi:hypothetical protein
MLSTQTINRFDRLAHAQNIYRPNGDISTQLAQKSIFLLVGATCVGKNTIMEALAGLDSRFHIIGTRTSREPRASDDPRVYTYYQNTDEGLQGVLDSISRGEVVQYVINTRSQLIYASTLADYSGEYAIGDTLSSAVADFQHLGFKHVTAISVVTDPVAWLARFEERFPPGDPHRQARRDEAIESLTWSLAQTGDGHFWVENIAGQPEVAAREVIQIADGQSRGTIKAQALAEASLAAAQQIAT